MVKKAIIAGIILLSLFGGGYFVFKNLQKAIINKTAVQIPANSVAIFSGTEFCALDAQFSTNKDLTLKLIRQIANNVDEIDHHSAIIACGLEGESAFYHSSFYCKAQLHVLQKLIQKLDLRRKLEFRSEQNSLQILESNKVVLTLYKIGDNLYLSNYKGNKFLSDNLSSRLIDDLNRGNEFLVFPKRLFQVPCIKNEFKEYALETAFPDSIYIAGNYIVRDESVEIAGIANFRVDATPKNLLVNRLWENVPINIQKLAAGSNFGSAQIESKEEKVKAKILAKGEYNDEILVFQLDSISDTTSQIFRQLDSAEQNSIFTKSGWKLNGDSGTVSYLKIDGFVFVSKSQESLENYLSEKSNAVYSDVFELSSSAKPVFKIYAKSASTNLSKSELFLSEIFGSATSWQFEISSIDYQLGLTGQLMFEKQEDEPVQEPIWKFKTDDSIVWGPFAVYNHQLKERTILIGTADKFLGKCYSKR